MPAAAMGPGVGGTSVCEVWSPSIRAMTVVASESLARSVSAWFSGASITNAESAKTGMEVT